jgi:hypothetical protein
VFVSIKPLNVSVFFLDHLQGVIRCALCRYYSSRLFAFVEFVLLRSMWPHVYVICACMVFLSVGDLLVNCSSVCGRMCMSSCELQFTSRSPADKNTKQAQLTHTCGHILPHNTKSTNTNQREE